MHTGEVALYSVHPETEARLSSLGCVTINHPGSMSSQNRDRCIAYRKSPQTLPKSLYRVFYDQSTTIYDSEFGFCSKLLFGFSQDFRESFISHTDWYCQAPSPFISLWDSKSKARTWANQRKQNKKYPHTNIRIATINSKKLAKDVFVFKTPELIRRLNAQTEVTRLAQPSDSDEYLALWHIPEAAIERIESCDDVSDVDQLGGLLSSLNIVQ